MQDWHYVYDPVGNLTAIVDAEADEVFFGGKVAQAARTYGYDALYRLKSASGREHASQSRPDQRDVPDWITLPPGNPNDLTQIVPYSEEYDYDDGGNLTTLTHRGLTTWTRTYTIDAVSNRLRKTTYRDDPTAAGDDSEYGYDERGQMTAFPHLDAVRYDHRGQMRLATRTRIGNTTDPKKAELASNPVYFGYDLRGQRVWKSSFASGSEAIRTYLDGFEVYVEKKTGLRRETLGIADDKERVALVETRVDVLERQLIRHQHSDHLGSAALELDENGEPLTYEEYHPYGTTAVQLGQAPKRYRFTGQERDEETGLQYHHHRYYAPWLGRWNSTDPVGLLEGTNRYSYCSCNPVARMDSTGTLSVAVGSSLDWDPGTGTAQASVSLSVHTDLFQLDLTLLGKPIEPEIEVGRESKIVKPAAAAHAVVEAATVATAPIESSLYAPPGPFASAHADASREMMNQSNSWLVRQAFEVLAFAVAPLAFVEETFRGIANIPAEIDLSRQYWNRARQTGSGWDYLYAAGHGVNAALNAAQLAGMIKIAASALKGPIHHIATNKNWTSAASGGPWSPRFEAIFKKAKMTLEDAANKVRVPGHKGPHPQAYHETIFDRLRAATEGLSGAEYAAALKAELAKIAEEAKTVGSEINKMLRGL